MSDAARHQVTRVRRDPRRRELTVTATEKLGANLLRIHFGCDDLADFESGAPDDHIKLFLPNGGFENDRPPMRDYTPRSWDAAAGTFVIEFALHGDEAGGAGPATAWAMAAKPGDTIRIGGPRGSAVVADDFDWYLLIGDETAIPAIARRVEELRPDVPITVLVAADTPADQFALSARPGLSVRWTFRSEGGDDGERLAALIDRPLPPGDGYVWIAAEGSVARAVRGHVVDTLGHPREWTKAAGYWTKGVADAHERIGD